ncbi:ABC transporter ATP-binding protein [Anaerocolumna sp. MB42-C2]|uniref:ABC transporter ATP-binding protein n=1 Tax=Anaerocolumna sp. MB42-C2 TaxID=3070997 RepID=UPI0027DF1254|nr:ABC transporter ATP-binding protein [Anaerocolumna sp. MB42-C2]WMJ87503.1 ABC transporter ATP-binding protein [Anaerocolumna sp. MB42-C2]
MEQDITLQINNLKTQFFTSKGVIPAVDEVNITIPKGKIVGLVGESGCGKSMTAMSVMQLLRKPGKVMGGEILFHGQNLLECSKQELLRIRGNRISMIFQEPMTSLNPVYTVGRQVREAIMLHEDISKEQARKRVIDIFKQVGIPEPERRYGAYPHQLSGGLRQRVMIGMAMICEPELLIADEPTTALDVTIEAQILNLMKKLREEHGTSILLITHNMGVVAEVCDYVYVMYAGKVMEQAETFELFKNTRHPYTIGLLRSIPQIEDKKEHLYNIKGMVPNLLNLPDGCSFCNRCEYATKRCEKDRPGNYRINDLHNTRCFLYEKGGDFIGDK